LRSRFHSQNLNLSFHRRGLIKGSAAGVQLGSDLLPYEALGPTHNAPGERNDPAKQVVDTRRSPQEALQSPTLGVMRARLHQPSTLVVPAHGAPQRLLPATEERSVGTQLGLRYEHRVRAAKLLQLLWTLPEACRGREAREKLIQPGAAESTSCPALPRCPRASGRNELANNQYRAKLPEMTKRSSLPTARLRWGRRVNVKVGCHLHDEVIGANTSIRPASHIHQDPHELLLAINTVTASNQTTYLQAAERGDKADPVGVVHAARHRLRVPHVREELCRQSRTRDAVRDESQEGMTCVHATGCHQRHLSPSSCAHLMAVPVSAALPSASPPGGIGLRRDRKEDVQSHGGRSWDEHTDERRKHTPATDVCGLEPVLMSMKVPVPIVIFRSPVSKQHSPNMAACWSAIWRHERSVYGYVQRYVGCPASPFLCPVRKTVLTTHVMGMGAPKMAGAVKPKWWLETRIPHTFDTPRHAHPVSWTEGKMDRGRDTRAHRKPLQHICSRAGRRIDVTCGSTAFCTNEEFMDDRKRKAPLVETVYSGTVHYYWDE
ncbi:hypothetical protein Z043_125679, partial [Scleropages formosus]